ncbi:helix-turn-helix domain-containing protein [Arboricoccus pini]|nr:helix-turn-helix domain-containing protein [Arboricoccus pini]
MRHSRDPLAEIACAAGYTAESAFSTTFSRVMGCPPRRYRRGIPVA